MRRNRSDAVDALTDLPTGGDARGMVRTVWYSTTNSKRVGMPGSS
jgi:hypothetical protein